MNPSHERFTALFDDLYPQVMRFAVRRVGPSTAEDIAAETFAIAWRRYGDMPKKDGEQRAWIFGIARRLMLAQARRALRDPLPVLADEVQLGHETSVVELNALLRGWRLLSDTQREVIALSAWDNLTSTEAASVLGISPVAYRIRLSRARSALDLMLAQAERTEAALPLHSKTRRAS